MPIYDFKCSTCKRVDERIVSSAVTVLLCPVCPHSSAERQLSVPAAFRFPDMVQLNRKRQRIVEPIWRDQVTGKIESVHP